MIVPVVVGNVGTGWLVSRFLTFHWEMLFGGICIAVGSGLLATMTAETSVARWVRPSPWIPLAQSLADFSRSGWISGHRRCWDGRYVADLTCWPLTHVLSPSRHLHVCSPTFEPNSSF